MTQTMEILSLLLSLLTLFKITNGSVPISDYFSSSMPVSRPPYNLIDADPSCWYEGLCPMFPPGGKLSVFPNNEEKYQQLLANMHRMHPNHSRAVDIGKYTFGADTTSELEFCKSCDFCGTYYAMKPMYWYSDANQVARFKQWDEDTCDQSWYDEDGISAHYTCPWGLKNITVWSGVWGNSNDNK